MAIVKLFEIPEDEAKEHLDGYTPSPADFRRVFKSIKSGVAVRHGTDFSGKRKTHKMVWCMAEALRAEHRDCLKRCTTLNLVRDERRRRLQLQFRGGRENGSVRAGVLGIPRVKDSSAVGLCEATLRCMKRFCTPLYAPPLAARRINVGTDKTLLAHLIAATEAITCDSAENEVVAAYDMMSRTSFISTDMQTYSHTCATSRGTRLVGKFK